MQTFHEMSLFPFSWVGRKDGQCHADPPENCHLNVKKMAKNLKFKKAKTVHFFFQKKLTKNVKFLAIVWHSNGNFPEDQHMTHGSIRDLFDNDIQSYTKMLKSGIFSKITHSHKVRAFKYFKSETRVLDLLVFFSVILSSEKSRVHKIF